MNLLMMAPGIRTGQPEVAPFNVAGAVSSLLGDWGTVMHIAKPCIWAPGWTAARLLDFVNGAFPGPRQPLPESALSDLTVSELPGLLSPVERGFDQPPEYSIVHLTSTSILGGNHGPLLQLGTGVWTPVGRLRDWLVRSGTRLLILEGAESWEKPSQRRLADYIVGGGGPTVLTLQGGNTNLVNAYFMDLYANIIHNRSLDEAADPGGRDLEVGLTYGQGDDDEGHLSGIDLLRFDKWMEELLEQQQTYADTVIEYYHVLDRLGRSVHRTELDQLRGPIDTLHNLIPRLDQNLARVRQIRASAWHHEYEGVIPLAEAAADFRRLQEIGGPIGGEGFHLLDYDPWLSGAREDVKELFHQARRAPRVLNAGFADVVTRRVLGSAEPLVAGLEYDLLVDVGPRWNRIPSLVVGQADFPEYAMDPYWEGHEIEVLLASEDFLPRLISGRLDLPRDVGRSFPVVDGRKSDQQGPVALRLRCRLAPDAAGAAAARGRLSLYYRGTLLQSAAVLAWVVPGAETRLRDQERNRIQVDFTLTNSFQELESRFAGRAVNLTMNDDGSNSHRIVIKCGLDSSPAPESAPPPAFVPYNPVATSGILQDVRDDLMSCFLMCDSYGGRTQEKALWSDNGKSKQQFLFDLRALASIGARLFKIVTDQPTVEGDQMNARQWSRALRDAMARPSILQVARTGKSEYCFPWGLVYDLPMPGPDFQFCPVTDQWSGDGRRQAPPKDGTCPFARESFHQENIFCPYGFWGLKHKIEQPLSVLKYKDGKWLPREAVNQIGSAAGISLAVGRTRDPQLNLSLIDAHLKALCDTGRMHFSPATPADDVTDLRSTLQAPTIVYFLCHGKFDPARKEPYLGVGAPDDKYHKIYPEMVQDWADTNTFPNLSGWATVRPLVFINGCHTCDLKPEQTLQFVSKFAYAEASGVLGTEISIQLPLALEVGDLVLQSIAAGNEVGKALYDMRWHLVNKGNLLGLSYTLYALADLKIISA
jgi:hypothetical protein